MIDSWILEKCSVKGFRFCSQLAFVLLTYLACSSVNAQNEICSSFPLWDDQAWKTGSDIEADDEYHRCVFWADYAFNPDVGDLHSEYTDFLVDATREKKRALADLAWKADVVYIR